MNLRQENTEKPGESSGNVKSQPRDVSHPKKIIPTSNKEHSTSNLRSNATKSTQKEAETIGTNNDEVSER